ncbi:hypothetical protein LEN26_019393 [Aphanomyces euteiches]|nr:hypothetical protein LEN26_019393 [Aphanomyces euteiches]
MTIFFAGVDNEYQLMQSFKLSTCKKALADNVFVVINTRRRREQLVVKLMDDDLEMDFMNYMNRRNIRELFNHVVEWKDWGDITFPNNIGQCIGLVLEAGTATLENRLRESVMKEDEYAKYSCVAHLINGVKMLHAQNIIHGNISLDNILYFGDKGHFKFIDFAVATLINQPMQSMCTPEYCPPEMAKHLLNPPPEGIPAKAEYDIWSLAVVIPKMFMPNFTLVEFHQQSDLDILQLIASGGFNFQRSLAACTLSVSQKNGLAACLKVDPNARASLQSLSSILPRKTTMDAKIRRVERQLMASQKTQVQLDKYKVPCLWTLQDTNPNPSGFMARGKPLLRKEIRIVCLCELRDAKPCELYDDDLPLVKANSDLVKKVLPILKASSLVVQALGLVVGWGGVIGDYFNQKEAPQQCH